MDGKRKIKRELTIVEGRDCNQKIVGELRDVAIKMGWKAKILKKISSADIADGNLDKVFSDCVIWRCPIDYKSTYEMERVICYLKQSGKILANTDPAGGRIFSSHKYFQHGLFQLDPLVAKHTLPAHMALSKDNLIDLVKRKKLKYPFLVKPDFGTRGEGIEMIRSEKDLAKIKEYPYHSTEEYIKSTYDWRVFVMGGVAIGAMKKQGDMTDDANFKSRASGKKRWNEDDINAAEELSILAVKAAEVSGLEYAGIDLIRDDKTGKFIILETNLAAGWQNGFFEATGVSVPEEIVNWFADRALLFEGSTEKAIKTYVENRLKFLTRKAQRKYEKIIALEENVNRSKKSCNDDLDKANVSVDRKLSSAYALLMNKPTAIEKAKIAVTISNIEKYEISRFGNFIGKKSGSLEDSIIRTAFYLAIKGMLK